MHSEKSGLCDFLTNSEELGIEKARELMETFSGFKAIKDRSFKPPTYDINELEGLIQKTLKSLMMLEMLFVV